MDSKFYKKNGLKFRGDSCDLLVNDVDRVIHVRMENADHVFSYALSRLIYDEVRKSYFFDWTPENSRLFFYTQSLVFEWLNGSLVSLSESDYHLIYNGFVS